MQSILLGTSQRSFTCRNTVWIQPLVVCTKPQGGSTLKRCKVHKSDTNPQTQTHRVVFRLAELASRLSWALSQGNHKGSTALSSCYERLPVLGEDAEVQIPNKKTEWERKILSIPWRRQRKSDWCSGDVHMVHQESILILKFYTKTFFCVPELCLHT